MKNISSSRFYSGVITIQEKKKSHKPPTIIKILTMAESRAPVRTFLRNLSEYIIAVNGAPDINEYMISTLVVLRNALYRHEDALNELGPLQSGEADAHKRRFLSHYLYRGLHTNARIFYFIRDYCGPEGDPAGVLNNRFEAALLSDHIVRETYEQQRVIYEYKIANNSLW